MPRSKLKKHSSSSHNTRVHPWLFACVSLFFLWHTFAIGIFAIPLSVRDPLSHPLRRMLRPIVTPYINLLSQWQDWHVFVTPDPLQYVKRSTIDFVRRGRMVNSEMLSEDQAKLAKDNVDAIGMKLLELFCKQNGGTRSDEARLIERWYLDRADPPMDMSLFDQPAIAMNRDLEWYEYTYAHRNCDTNPSS